MENKITDREVRDDYHAKAVSGEMSYAEANARIYIVEIRDKLYHWRSAQIEAKRIGDAVRAGECEHYIHSLKGELTGAEWMATKFLENHFGSIVPSPLEEAWREQWKRDIERAKVDTTPVNRQSISGGEMHATKKHN